MKDIQNNNTSVLNVRTLVGKKAPDFTASIFHENHFKQIKLSALRGKWVVIAFYPGDFTFICPTELSIFDSDRIVKSADVHDNSIGRSVKEVLRKLQAAKYVREHGGEVCPVEWESGAKTLKPGIGLVGKI